eukprot:TRINITY_DN10598_c0_g1_i1.p1 TRINITY_DN10598_c0_g1~~TRINITY_DN10598_c0_g1_i1.p1  ORF type:complete len:641 (+),score=96.41 TRINITY_DN10598_c0_g1_i1:76-1998(+)
MDPNQYLQSPMRDYDGLRRGSYLDPMPNIDYLQSMDSPMQSTSTAYGSWSQSDLEAFYHTFKNFPNQVHQLYSAFPSKPKSVIKELLDFLDSHQSMITIATDFVDLVKGNSNQNALRERFTPRSADPSKMTSVDSSENENKQTQDQTPITSSGKKVKKRLFHDSMGGSNQGNSSAPKRKPPKQQLIAISTRSIGPKFAIFPQPNSISGAPAKLSTQQNFQRIRSFLSSDKARLHCMCEWFYSTIDRPFFEKNEFLDLMSLLKKPQFTHLTRLEWQALKSSELKPRRFSRAFLKGERESLARYREQTRILMHNRNMDHFGGVVQVPSLAVGQCVQAYHPVCKSLHSGIILMITDSTCYVCFDQASLGAHYIPDYQLQVIAEGRRKLAPRSLSGFQQPARPLNHTTRFHRYEMEGQDMMQRDETDVGEEIEQHDFPTQPGDSIDPRVLFKVTMLLNRKQEVLKKIENLNDQAEVVAKQKQGTGTEEIEDADQIHSRMKDLISQLHPINQPLGSIVSTLRATEEMPVSSEQNPHSPSTYSLAQKLSSVFTDVLVDDTFNYISAQNESPCSMVPKEGLDKILASVKSVMYLLHLVCSLRYDPSSVWGTLSQEWRNSQERMQGSTSASKQVEDQLGLLSSFIFPK